MIMAKSDKKTTDKLIATFDNLELANKLRSRLMFDLTPRPWVYVISDSLINDEFQVLVANARGGVIDTEGYQQAVYVYHEFLSGSEK